VLTTWITSPSVNTPRKANEPRRAKQLSGTASASNKSRFIATAPGFASLPNSIRICRPDNAVQKICRPKPAPRALRDHRYLCSPIAAPEDARGCRMVRSHAAAAQTAITGNGLPSCYRRGHRSRRPEATEASTAAPRRMRARRPIVTSRRARPRWRHSRRVGGANERHKEGNHASNRSCFSQSCDDHVAGNGRRRCQ
jgi:hypothetical protein